MDPISKHLADWKLPVGQWGKAFIDFIIEHFQWFFDAISATLQWLVEGSSYLLLQVPPLLLAAILAGIAGSVQVAVMSRWIPASATTSRFYLAMRPMAGTPWAALRSQRPVRPYRRRRHARR